MTEAESETTSETEASSTEDTAGDDPRLDADETTTGTRRAKGADRRRPASPGRSSVAGDGRSRRPAAVLVAVAAGFALLAVALAVMVVRFKSDRDDLTATRDSNDELARSAGDLAAAMMQFDYQNPEAGRSTIERLAGTQVVGQYNEALPLLSASFKDAQAIQAATIKQIYIEHGSTEDEASAIVIVDLLISGQGVSSTLPNVRLEMTFAQLDGHWKATGVTNLNELLAGRGPRAPADTTTSTTTTTAPPAP